MSFLEFANAEGLVAGEGDIVEDQLCDENHPHCGEVFDTIKFLNSDDYTLNSPLIKDELENLEIYIRTGVTNKMWERPDWGLWKSFLQRRTLGINQIEIFHKEWPKLFRTGSWDVSLFEKWITRTTATAEITKVIPEIFFRAWLGKELKYTPRVIEDNWIKITGQVFLDLHLIIQAMNAATRGEIASLKKFTELDDHCVTNGRSMLRYKMGNGETVFLTKHHVYFPRSGWLWDKNMTLMVKDTLIARVMTYLTLINRTDNRYSRLDIANLRSFYDKGDRILLKIGNEGFDYLKMIEPMCIRTMAMITRERKPLLQVPSTFEDFIRDKVDELTGTCSEMGSLWDLIAGEQKLMMVLVYFSSFRHFGHPVLDYFEGLNKLHEQVTAVKVIDEQYANQLASDLAFKVMKSQYKRGRVWSVNLEEMSVNHPFYNHVRAGSWPTEREIESFGDKWHKLPLKQCFDIPDLIDPSVIYSDKSHSLNRTELIEGLTRYPHKPIKTCKVLRTFIEREATNWKDFFEGVNDNGLERDDLVIGLRGKEREVKRVGRFFALMSWKLREYFVSTEYLIKRHFVPLFSGLTMADDLTELTRKMMKSSSGQGDLGYDKVGIANHIDYEKWNNQQRLAATEPVFTVMDKFLGYSRLISRTHLFFEGSLVYYLGRPDLLVPNGDSLTSRGDERVCWEGQAGGLEGLRQKGWSILNMLVIEREMKVRNAKVTLLAQGDNQVITTHYKTELPVECEDLDTSIILARIVKNNEAIMNAVRDGVGKLGLRIKMEETLQSAAITVYGKNFIVDGSPLVTETKKTSRNTCTTNDQIPSFGSILSTISTNTLTISHGDTSPIEPIWMFNFFGNLARSLIELHNPAIRRSMYGLFQEDSQLIGKGYLWSSLFLDPTLGGISGCSLTRFMMRMFPDPLTEGLTFFKKIHNHTEDKDLKGFCEQAGNPPIKAYIEDDFPKLLESPTSLNLSRSISAQTILKNEVKKHMLRNYHEFKNSVVKECTEYASERESIMLAFLRSISPMFPRFCSEYKSATFLGISDSIIGMYQNSRTIRGLFAKKMRRELDTKIYRGERAAIKSIVTRWRERKDMWTCSSSHADLLRKLSWGEDLVGTTVPHPWEMLGTFHEVTVPCSPLDYNRNDYITVHVPQGLDEYLIRRGPLQPYLGSKTSETTSILTPWEKETSIPLLKRAARLREVISWFVKPGSNLASSILNNLRCLTGEDWSQDLAGFERTGSALHRFQCQRVSPGGYCATSPSKMTWMNATTDTLYDVGSINYDFMFQSLLLYSLITTGEVHAGRGSGAVYHYHVDCSGCLREIEDIVLESVLIYAPGDKSHIIKRWIPTDHVEPPVKKRATIRRGNWFAQPYLIRCYMIGVTQGFVVGDSALMGNSLYKDSDVFPLTLLHKLDGEQYLNGVLDGLYRAVSLSLLHKRSLEKLRNPIDHLKMGLDVVISGLVDNPGFCNLCRGGNIRSVLVSSSHKIPASYPVGSTDIQSLVYSFFMRRSLARDFVRNPVKKYIWIFSDVYVREIIGPFAMSYTAFRMMSKKSWKKKDIKEIRALRDYIVYLRSKESEATPDGKYSTSARLADVQLRAAIKLQDPDMTLTRNAVWGEEFCGPIRIFRLQYIEGLAFDAEPPMTIPRKSIPLISGLRWFQCATGAHYKYRSLLKALDIQWTDAICGGDGSGGISALLLRENRQSRVIFNSLLTLEGVELRGSSPGPPSAVEAMGEMKGRCINFTDAWRNPSDLNERSTWDYFRALIQDHQLCIDLITCDAEWSNRGGPDSLLANMLPNVLSVLVRGGTFIYKTYLDQVLNHMTRELEVMGGRFRTFMVATSELSSSGTSEIFLIFEGKRKLSDRVLGHINWWPIRMDLDAFFCFREDSDELNRARTICLQDLFVGVPSELIPDIRIEFGEMLRSLGIIEDTRRKLLILLTGRGVNLILLLKLIVHLASRECLGAGPRLLPRKPPSIGQVKKLGAFCTSALYLKGLEENDLGSYVRANQFIKEGFPLCWSKTKHYNRVSQEITFLHSWNLLGRGLNRVAYLQDKMAHMGSIIRVMSRLDRELSGPHLQRKALEAAFGLFLGGKGIYRETGTIELFDTEEKLSFPSIRGCLTGVEEVEIGYRD
ncbi:RNA-dependent RNA polymerase [Lepeophtheirus salmonis rhabdovirus 9]|uniref:Replicase n=1 Tax=Lepeophtheirus salmonis rhabdovirus 9 TaxID=1573760 RepID=A0A0A1EBK2_9RHAB|nr:RNA-dependent RNA polymerase [Lepeophtheirus salmonis rhabdovirus 9]AIY25911.1 RNA-dependent RNA polymerase [Lepeophtheirus salmonis rhabdovirus 9]